MCERMAILLVDYTNLQKILQLPDGAKIVDMKVPFDRSVLEVKIAGAGWMVGKYDVIQKITGQMDDATGKIVWELPM